MSWKTRLTGPRPLGVGDMVMINHSSAIGELNHLHNCKNKIFEVEQRTTNRYKLINKDCPQWGMDYNFLQKHFIKAYKNETFI